MALDKVVDSSVLEAGLATIANAIREKGGTSETLAFPDGMAEAIAAIETGSGNTVVGEFTLTDSLTKAAPLVIDNAFTQNTLPLVFGVWEKPFSSLYYIDTTHTVTRLKFSFSIRDYKENGIRNGYYRSFVGYDSSGSSSTTFLSDKWFCPASGYSTVGGLYGVMLFDLAAKQIQFKTIEDGAVFINGRTYYYFMLWSDTDA